jgi:hypothetical protein
MLGNLSKKIQDCSPDEWLNQTQAIIADIEQEIARFEETKKRAEERIQSLQEERTHLKAAMDSYRKRHRMSSLTVTERQRALLKDKPAYKQARLLAFWSDYELVMKDAVKLLAQEGFLEGDHPDSVLYAAVTRDDAFERVKRGVYRFTPPEGWTEDAEDAIDDSETDGQEDEWKLKVIDRDGDDYSLLDLGCNLVSTGGEEFNILDIHEKNGAS